MGVKNKAPFQKSVEHAMELRGIDVGTAVTEVQARYDSFIERNEKLVQRQNDQGNRAQIQLISHFALLATLALTVTGFLITQTEQPLTDPQKNLILVILLAQAVSLFFGALDYLQTIKFHMVWAKVYQLVGREVEKRVGSGDIQTVNEMGEIEQDLVNKTSESTKVWITYLMVIFCLVGLGLLIFLFYAYFFDVPFWQNS
jgi:hypothetical protein